MATNSVNTENLLETHKRRSLAPTQVSPEPTGAVTITAGAASLAAGLMHYAATGTHLPTETVAAVLFTLVGGFQIVWPALLRQDRRWILVAGLAVNAVVVVGWTLSRTTGLPFGAHPGVAEPVGLLDAAAVVAELVVVATATVLLRRHRQRGAGAE